MEPNHFVNAPWPAAALVAFGKWSRLVKAGLA